MTNKTPQNSQQTIKQKPIEKFINQIICGDVLKVLKQLPSDSIDCVITSPPYFNLRDYGVIGQIGLEADFNDYLEKLLVVSSLERFDCWFECQTPNQNGNKYLALSLFITFS